MIKTLERVQNEPEVYRRRVALDRLNSSSLIRVRLVDRGHGKNITMDYAGVSEDGHALFKERMVNGVMLIHAFNIMQSDEGENYVDFEEEQSRHGPFVYAWMPEKGLGSVNYHNPNKLGGVK